MLADGCSVNRAIEKILELDDSEDDDLLELGLQPSASPLPADLDIPMGASQSNPLSQPLPAPNTQQGKRPSQKRPPKSTPVMPILPHPASLNVESMSQAHMLRQSQQLSHEQPSRQASGSLDGGLARAGSSGAVMPSRLGAAGQGRASGLSQQARCSPSVFCSHADCFLSILVCPKWILLLAHTY